MKEQLKFGPKQHSETIRSAEKALFIARHGTAVGIRKRRNPLRSQWSWRHVDCRAWITEKTTLLFCEGAQRLLIATLRARLPFGGSVGCSGSNCAEERCVSRRNYPLAAAHRRQHAEELVHQLQLPSSHFFHHFVIDLQREYLAVMSDCVKTLRHHRILERMFLHPCRRQDKYSFGSIVGVFVKLKHYPKSRYHSFSRLSDKNTVWIAEDWSLRVVRQRSSLSFHLRSPRRRARRPSRECEEEGGVQSLFLRSTRGRR